MPVSEFCPAHEDETLCVAYSSIQTIIDPPLVTADGGVDNGRKPKHIASPSELLASVSKDGTIKMWHMTLTPNPDTNPNPRFNQDVGYDDGGS